MSRFALTNARYVGEYVDIAVCDGVIESVSAHGVSSFDGYDVIDAAGRVLFPGFIDAHVHLREPGFEWKETVATGLAAAAHGGFCGVMCMANTAPTNDNAAVTALILSKAAKAYPHGPYVYPIGAATVGLRGDTLAPMSELAEAGCVAISNDGVPIASTEIMRRVMEYAADFGLTVIDHCEDPWLAKGACMNEGVMSGILGLRGQPDMGEAVQAERDIMLAEYLNLPVHIAHVSCARTIDAIRNGKKRGVKVTAETCPHYLLLDESLLEGYNLRAKVNPPLRTVADRDAVRAAVKDGTLDILVTDHAPHAAHEKELPLAEAPNGFTGLDLAMTKSYELVKSGILTEADLIRLWCTRPAEIFRLPKNDVKAGCPASFFLFDPELEWQVLPENIYSKSCNTPWYGDTVKGRVTDHWIAGVKVV